MSKTRRKWLGILVVLAFAASLVPLATPAQAASSYQMSYVAKVKAPYTGPIGNLIISMDGISASNAAGSEVVLSLPSSPSGYELLPGYFQTFPVSGALPSGETVANLATGVRITLKSGELEITLKGNDALATNTTWGSYTVEATASGTVSGASISSSSKYTGTVNVSGTIKDATGAVKATFSGTVDLTSTTATTLTLTPAAGETLPTGAAVTAEVSTNSPAAGALPSITRTNYFDGSARFTITRLSNTSIKLKVDAVNSGDFTDKTSLISIPLNVTIPAGVSGDVNLTVSAPANSQFSSGSVVIAQVGAAKVELAVENVPTISAAGGKIGVIDLKETLGGALKDNAVTLSLPAGFKWADKTLAKLSEGIWAPSNIDDYVTVVWGDDSLKNNLKFEVKNDARDLKISDTVGTSAATFLKLQLYVLPIETEAQTGDVKVSVSGASPSELVVARYGDYGVSVKSVSTETVLSGKLDQKLGKFAIEEVIPGSLVQDRTIILTLPDKAKWTQEPSIDADNSKLGGLVLSNFTKVDDRTVKATVTTASSTDPAYVVIKGGKITVAASYSGDVELTVSGSAGASGKVKVAEAKPAVTATASGATQVIIGEQNQAAAEITLTEAKKEALTQGKELLLQLPSGVRFASVPTFAVTEGNLKLGTAQLDADDTVAKVKVDASSTTPSTIKVSNIKLTLSRTVPVGDVVLKVGGDALVENTAYFAEEWAAKVVVAQCVTPAPVEQKVTATFKVGDTSYTVAGETKTMDVAPFVEAGRTYIAVRYAAYAVGVSEDAILWDAATRTATFIKGDRVVQLTADSNKMLVNGAIITMDVPAKVVNGRMVVPIRWVGIAFGCAVDWDEATQTVTITR